MMKGLKFAKLNIHMNFQNAKELKSAFITSIVGMCLNNSAFIILWLNFGAVVGNINGWDKFDIVGLYGFSTTSFGLVFSFLYGIMNIPSYISTGNFDKFLLTPKNTLLKVATSAVSTSAIGDIVFGLICYTWFAFFAHFTLLQVLASLVLLAVASIVTFSFTLICMSMSFYFMEGENISNGLFQMFLTPSLYHGGAFSKVLRFIFIFIIPSLLLGATPVEVVKNLNGLNLIGIVLLSLFWLIVSILFFYKSLKKYESNNFFGFSG